MTTNDDTALYGIIDQVTGKLVDVQKDFSFDIDLWMSNTKQILKSYSISEVYFYLEECINELSEKQWLEKRWLKDKKFPKRDIEYKLKRKSVIKLNLKKQALRKKINDNLKIKDVALKYGLILKGNKCICPFHNDKDPSLVFYPETNTFHCFGCRISGNLIKFIYLMENKK